jgi:broad specificity phosphatase PhoE
MSSIYMIRHGQASFGERNYDRLSERGVLQSRLLARYWAKIGFRCDAAYAGRMVRQQDTAREILDLYTKDGLPFPELIVDEAFNEYNSASIILSHVQDLAGEDPALERDLKRIYTDKRAFQRVFERIMMKWIAGKDRRNGLDTWEEFRNRVWGGLRRIMAIHGKGRTVVVFTSGGPISAALQLALGISDEQTLRIAWQIVNASITKFLYNAERISLAGFNETAHLDLERDRSLVTYR